MSGYVNSRDSLFSGQTASTGSILDNKINSLSGASVLLYGNQTISGIKTFAENAVFGDPTQGDFLVISGNTFTIYGSGNFTNGLFVSGVAVLTGVDLSSYATVNNLFSTGSILNNKINSLSGYVNSQDVIFSGQIASSGSNLDNKINSLSGVSVLTFGNQTIAGEKTFTDKLAIGTISGLKSSNPNSLNLIASNDNTVFAGLNLAGDINLTAGTGTSFGISTYGAIKLNAGGAKYDGQVNLFGNLNVNNTSAVSSRTINIYKTGMSFGSPSAILGLTINNDNILLHDPELGRAGFGLYISGVGVTPALYANLNNLASTGSILDNKINALSGYVNFQDIIFSGQTFNTGSRLDNKINSLSGFLNNNVVYVTGNQTILGQKTFSGTTTVIGHFAATSKSFLIDHPLDNNRKLQYASLEGPEHGVFLRGKTNENIINLPNYWPALVNENSISVNLTPISAANNIYVVDYNNKRITTNGNNGNYYFYTIYGERKDIPKLTVEF